MRAPKFHDFRAWQAFDVETTADIEDKMHALQPWSEYGRVNCFATAISINGKVSAKSTLRRADNTELWCAARDMLATGHSMVGWNVCFDAAWLINMGLRKEVMEASWLDAMLLWKHWQRIPESDINRGSRKSYRLKLAVAEFLPKFAGYDDGVEFHGDTEEDWNKLLKYNKLDAALTLKLAEFFWQELAVNPRQLRNALIEAAAIPMVADHHITGIYVDLDYADKLDAEVAEEIAALGTELTEHGATATILASPKQLAVLLFDDWGLPSNFKTDGGARATHKEALHELSFVDPRASTVRRYRELQGLRTKFIEKIVESCDYNETPVSHPTANMGGTYTGRMTFSSFIGKNKDKRQTGFAIHQMSGKPEYRRVITVPHGFTLLEWDAAGQEFRWMAVATGDDTMLQLCEHGEDAHAFMGAEIYPEWEYRNLQDLAKHGDREAYGVRKLGKVSNLSCQYRIGKPKFRSTARVQYDLDLSVYEAGRIHDTYHQIYPGVKKYWRRAIRTAKLDGYSETVAGRRVQLNVDWTDKDRAWMWESAAINFPIQGVGADQKYLAMSALKPLLTKFSGRFYFELHDGLYAIAPTRKAEALGYAGRKILSNLPYKKAWGYEPPIPLPWDLKMGPNWGDLEEIE